VRVLKTFVLVLILVSLQVGLFGCGSGSETAAPTVSKMRTLQVGDSWTYDISGQNSSVGYTGTWTMSITQGSIAGVSVLAETSTINFVTNGSNTSSSLVGYMQQDPITGNVHPYAIKDSSTNDQVVTVTDRPLPIVWPGSWEAGKTITSTIHYSNGTSETASYTIIGQESVATPAGVITAWKLTISNSSNAGTASGIIWFSTELGNYVRMDMTNSTGTASYTLRSTTVK
jgi:hypothetical protein